MKELVRPHKDYNESLCLLFLLFGEELVGEGALCRTAKGLLNGRRADMHLPRFNIRNSKLSIFFTVSPIFGEKIKILEVNLN